MSIINIKTDEFEEKVLKADKPVLVDFWATWCGPCQMQGPILEELSNERDDIIVAKVNVDEEPQLAFKYSVSSIPLMILYKDGEPAARALGLHRKGQLVEALGL